MDDREPDVRSRERGYPRAAIADRYDQLRRLADRHEAGQVSDAEYRQEKRRILRSEPSRGAQVEIVVAIYATEVVAEAALDHLRALQHTGQMCLRDASLIKAAESASDVDPVPERADCGEVDVDCMPPWSSAEWLRAIDALVDADIDQDIRPVVLQEIQKHLKPGQVAVGATVEHPLADDLTEALAGFKSCARYALGARARRDGTDRRGS